MIKYLAITFIHISLIYNTQAQTKTDSALVDSIMIMLDERIKNWNPDDEPWTFISFEIEKIDLKISYGQQLIHPFLAEYNRKILFETQSSKTDTIDMTLNWGGRTYIELYYDSGNKLIVMEDSFGRYFFDLNTMKYTEKLEDFGDYKNKYYIGCINGTDYPLKFESLDSEKPTSVDTIQGRQVLYIAETMPEFPGGESAFGNFLANGIKYDSEDHPTTSATVTFVIDTFGNTVNVEIVEPLYSDKLSTFEQSIVKVINSMPDWKPAEHEGKKVPIRYKIPIHVDPQ